MQPEQFPQFYPISEFRLVGYITPMFGGFTIRTEIVPNGELAGEGLNFIPSGPFATEAEAKFDTTTFATSSGYDLSWVGPATWR